MDWQLTIPADTAGRGAVPSGARRRFARGPRATRRHRDVAARDPRGREQAAERGWPRAGAGGRGTTLVFRDNSQLTRIMRCIE